MLRYTFLLLGFMMYSCTTQSTFDHPWDEILTSGSAVFNRVIDSLDHYEVQVLYTQIDHGDSGDVILTSHPLHIDNDRYYYPASTVKMPTAFLAIEYINELATQNPEIDLYTRLAFDSIAPPQTQEILDSTSSSSYPNVAHYIEKIFSVSDNNAYNRLYELMGQDYINERLQEKGIFNNSKIVHRVGVGGFDTEANRYTNPYQILSEDEDELYALYRDYPIVDGVRKGIGRYDDNLDSILYEPFDFSHKNFISVTELQQSLIRVIYPELYDSTEQYNITSGQLEFLRETMTKTPDQYPHLEDQSDYYDSYVKFLMYGDSKDPIPDHIKISNKVGWAYGYLTDCAYIEDTQRDIRFFLTATIHVNKNQIYNDGVYEYDSIGIPFLAELGRQVYNYELTRSKH
jgi:hypothetical protein